MRAVAEEYSSSTSHPPPSHPEECPPLSLLQSLPELRIPNWGEDKEEENPLLLENDYLLPLSAYLWACDARGRTDDGGMTAVMNDDDDDLSSGFAKVKLTKRDRRRIRR